jgi:hypothetical protein|tara:strand:+ start:726 stop:1229 length:504 start_codon:yes stop_codon:yes gene_type:complete
MKKKVLSEQSIYTGDILMPKGFEIEEKILTSDILESKLLDDKFKFSKTFDRLHTYISENINLKYGFTLINKNTFGEVYEPKEVSPPLLNVDPVDLRHSPDFTLLYGVSVNDCNVQIFYDDNRRKGRSWDVSLTTNSFVMFPSTNMYIISNNQKHSLNFIQTILYEYF